MAKGQTSVFLKRVRNGGIFRVPREIKIHRLAMAAQVEHGPFTARLLGYRRGIFSSELHIERLDGPSPKHIGELSDVGALIARVEANTNRLFKVRRVAIDPKLDFYLSGARHGRRYDISSIAAAYRRNNQPPFPEFEDIVQLCATSIARNEAQLMGAEPVLSHLDHLAKNFIRTGEGVFLIDWGEGYIGRRGFDAGSFLMVLLRSYDVSRFESEANLFCRSYLARAIGGPDVLAAMNRVFLPRSLWYFLRPDIVSRFQTIGKLDEWRAKLLILGRFASGQFWRHAGLSDGERSTEGTGHKGRPEASALGGR
ncbi:phosphotransferase [Sinorhizobium meliloti]|uniref:Phosphotransferase n=1 Tax=Rhizobium meliloti TaxID=382 RepID=A0A6A7ZUF6_RHIML|nr:phosphotransferase [Sinorhizobium meliloti]MDW9376821.1 phosphotransferase [Sinorhizobium meliloti]MDW9495367.1 phosphotransferase [Sinorhizobium meliloti]MDW9563722.1 phosphotransferase [Sinorhizobium meliloti]MDW9651144.1 phosphotransferase [Sinorhizobium meliloti]MDW9861606.1 phosphotransferase [Sinorhizobium meliloti]